MKRDMKYTIRLLMLLTALIMGAAGEVKAITDADIVFSYDNNKGSANVKTGGIETVTGGTKVTITVTPGTGYFINKSNVVAYKLVDPALAPRRALSLDEPLEVSGPDGPQNEATDYSFVVPDDFKGAQVTITFITKTVASAEVKANDLVYNQQAQALFTVTNVKGGKVKFYKKDGDTYTEIVEATGIGILFEKKENRYEEVDVSAGDPEDLAAGLASGKYIYFYIPKETNAAEYTYHYKIIPDAGYSIYPAEGYEEIKVTIKKAKLTKLILTETVKSSTNPSSELTFAIDKVMAGELEVQDAGYEVKDNSNKGTETKSYLAIVKATTTTDGKGLDSGQGNYQGEANASFRIVDGTVEIVYVDENTTIPNEAASLTKHYILKRDLPASKFENLKSGNFTGTFDGDMHTITGTLDHPLLDCIFGGTVKNVIIENATMSVTGHAGAIAKTTKGDARIFNCGVLSGTITGTQCVGGILGRFADPATNSDEPVNTSHVVNCFSYADVSTGKADNVWAAGIVGYNNTATTASNLKTMVMNCMFYGDITEGKNIAPVYGGQNINNKNSGGLTTFNYYAYSKLKTKAISNNNNYNCALAVEEKFLNRFEIYRQLLNSNKKLAAIYASTTSTTVSPNEMAKWVLETADRNITNPKPYPVLKRQGYYPSIINIDAESARKETGRNKGGFLGTLSVTISDTKTDGGQTWPTGASVTTKSLTLNRTDKDEDRFNFNYDKVQLPYYNDVGTGNYTENLVVTGWKITSVTGGTPGTYETGDKWNGYNFADRECTQKDVYSVSGRVFSQGAYYDVPYGVTAITIEPYWGQAAYVSDQYYDVVYKENGDNNLSGENVTGLGEQVANNDNGTDMTINGDDQKVYTTIEKARSSMSIPESGKTVYDYAVVLVGNVHQAGPLYGAKNTPYTIMSVDLDKDNEPDYSFIFSHFNRQPVSAIRFDFINVPGTSQAQKPSGGDRMFNVSIFNPKGWFEVTNTCLVYIVQFEADNGNKTAAPVIFLGGVVDQFTSTKDTNISSADYNRRTSYIHVGSNAWFKAFGNGTHSDGWYFTYHVPVSVTGGDFDGFYLSGVYRPDAQIAEDDAEAYISGGRFKEMAGASQQMIAGNVHWQIYEADITNFYGGGVNADKPIIGDITVDIINSHVGTYCGGPKFGDMQKKDTEFSTKYSKNKAGTNTGTWKKTIDKDGIVTTNATGCTFGKFFGAGYGGASSFKLKYYDSTGPKFSDLQTNYTNDRGKYFNGTDSKYKSDYGNKGPGVATDFDYEFFVWSSGKVGARFYVNYTTLSLAQTNDVNSNLTNCIINGNFYGGGNLGKVEGTAKSVLDGCTVYGDVFGGGFSASKEPVPVRDSGFKTNKLPSFNKYSGVFDMGEKSDATDFDWKEGTFPENDKKAIDEDNGNHDIITNKSLTTLGQVDNTDLTIRGNTYVQGVGDTGGVFGGGDASSVNNNTIVKIEATSTKGDKIGVNNVYGGGNKANVSGNTKVILLGGTINGDAYGGGKGQLAAAAVGTEGEEGYKPAVTAVAAKVGATTVFLNGMEKADYTDEKYGSLGLIRASGSEDAPYIVGGSKGGCVVNGRIFGCNNLNGSPLDNATVHIYKTAGASRTPKEDLDNIDDNAHHYHVQAVYGGGNLAAFEPTDKSETSTAKTHVIIDGCDMTSIKQVYGGGNAASTPATFVEVNGTYEIGEVFGGGNGKDPIGEGKPNPGANVGYYDYSLRDENGVVLVTEGAVQEKENANTVEKRQANYQYGSGEANVRIYGGKIHRVFGGSNTLGNVRNIALTLLDGQEDCDFSVDEAYGGGKSAPMDGAAKLEMACIPGLKAAYGGAEEAEIHNDVTLNITNGTFDRVFGGNNVQGKITGTITVNIEETGCRPIIIGQLYGGGNQAPYEAAEGKTGPTINVRSFTSIGDIFGGGYGKTATVEGDTHVNINVAEGDFVNQDTDDELTGNKTISFQQFQRNDNGTFVYDETNDPGHTTRLTEPKSINLYLPPHAAGEIGGINNVYGGGNEAVVDGNTQVSIGTEKYVLINTIAAGDDLTGKNYYTRSGAGTAESPYVYEKATGTASANTEYYALVKGANILGNVYGGGNEANVTGSTNVNIGRKVE